METLYCFPTIDGSSLPLASLTPWQSYDEVAVQMEASPSAASQYLPPPGPPPHLLCAVL